MDINLVYMILGVLVTLVVGYWGIKYTSRYTKRTNLLFFENSCISLFRKVVKNLDELEIKYKGKAVDKNLIIFKGTFFNSGNTDIDKSIIHKPLEILLPKDYEWRKVGIIDKSDDVNIEITSNSNELIFTWDILKENEFFTFDSVIEYKPEISDKDSVENVNITRNLSKNIKFTQRITNLKLVEKERLPTKPLGILLFTFISIYLLGFVLLGLYWSAGQFVFPDYKVVNEVEIDSTFKYVTIEIENKNEIKLIDSLGNNISTLSINNFNKTKFTGKIKTCKKEISYIGLIGGGLFSLFLLIIYILIVNSLLKDKKLYKKIKRIADKYDEPKYEERRSSIPLFPF